jgi:hypothetical protein
MNPGHTRIACVFAVAGLMLPTTRAARADVVLEWNAIAMRALTAQKPMVTPCFQSYPSNHASGSNSSAETVLAARRGLSAGHTTTAESLNGPARVITEAREENGLVPTSIFRSVSVSAAQRVAVFNRHVSLPNDLRRTTTCDDWPNIDVEDAYTRDAATRALEGASRWLARSKCQTLFVEFKDERNLPLTAKLRELDTDPEGYLRMVLFLNGAQSATCRRHGVLAFTARGSRVVYLCGRDFERAWRRDVAEVQATIIHELLHSLGLGENPPSPRAITHRIQQLCW